MDFLSREYVKRALFNPGNITLSVQNRDNFNDLFRVSLNLFESAELESITGMRQRCL